jgi:hypothetical protein
VPSVFSAAVRYTRSDRPFHQLPNTKIKFNYAAENLFHIDGTPREDFVPTVVIKLSDKRIDDVSLGEGIRTLRG